MLTRAYSVDFKVMKQPSAQFKVDSIILQTDYDRDFLGSLVEGKALTLLYRGSKDGWKLKTFHDKCDVKGPTITIFKTKEGRVCGGFTSKSWESAASNKVKKDPASFLFSVDSHQIFRVKEPQFAMTCDIIRGPYFGKDGCLAALYDPINYNDYCCSKVTSTTFGALGDKDGNSILTGKKEKFTAAEIEVFRL